MYFLNMLKSIFMKRKKYRLRALVKWFDYYLDPSHAFIYFAIEHAFISTIISSLTNMVVITPLMT